LTNDFLGADEVAALGLASVGRGVSISRHAMLLMPERTRIGDWSRIDAYCVISAGNPGLSIGRNVHISSHVTILGRGPVEIGDFATISVRCSIFSSNDDYSGEMMTNPTVPAPYRISQDAPVTIGMHAIVGAGAIVLPGTRIGESAAVGAASLVRADVPDFSIAVGIPARVIGERDRGHRRLAEEMLRAEALANEPGGES
jgi:acetyltransferase-like isoleucine patch superfamily enzyme